MLLGQQKNQETSKFHLLFYFINKNTNRQNTSGYEPLGSQNPNNVHTGKNSMGSIYTACELVGRHVIPHSSESSDIRRWFSQKIQFLTYALILFAH